MENNYGKALKEVYEILFYIPIDEFKKISPKFLEFIFNNMDNDYTPNISFNENFENSVLDETLLIIALIYRDYIVDKDEREKLLKEENDLLNQYYDEVSADKIFNSNTINNNSNINNIFTNEDNNSNKVYDKDKSDSVNDEIINTSNLNNKITVIKDESWYKKIINKIIGFFKN